MILGRAGRVHPVHYVHCVHSKPPPEAQKAQRSANLVIDVNAYTGHWANLPLKGDVASVRSSLRAMGVDRICLSPLNAAWCTNPHFYNAEVYEAAERYEDVLPVPILDPTLPVWSDELERAVGRWNVRLVKLLPAYSPYELSEAEEMLLEIEAAGVAVIIQTRLEDPRRQHPLAQVPDVPPSAVADVAECHPSLTTIIGGPRFGEIRSLKERLLALPNLYADVSQADGFDGLKVLVAEGLTTKLLFGSHAPFFIPYSALARVVNDLDEADAAAILGGNAERVLGIG
jgi:predicted TIM-barrel fold metal-dependent hydrolase